VRDVRRTDLGEVVVVVVRLVGQAEAALGQVDDVLVGLLGVGVDPVVEDARHTLQLELPEDRDQAGQILGLADQRELVGDRLGAQLLDRLGVHEARVEVGDLPRLAALRVAGRGGLLDDRPDVLLGGVPERVERTVDRLVRGNLVLSQPRPVHEPVQVVLRPHRAGRPRAVDSCCHP
jgi:hypothetical protein